MWSRRDGASPPLHAAEDGTGLRSGDISSSASICSSCLAPLYWVLITSIKPSNDYLAVPPVWFPGEPTLVHYAVALFCLPRSEGADQQPDHFSFRHRALRIYRSLMAYSLARFNTGGKHLSFWVLSQRFLPPVAIVLPVFLIYRNAGLHDTHIGLIIAYTVFTLPVSVWMMYAYFRQLPRSMEDAALGRRLHPLAGLLARGDAALRSGHGGAAVFAFIACWTEFFFALVLTSRDAFTLPTVFRAFIGFQGALYGEASALADRVSRTLDRARHFGPAPSRARPHTWRGAWMK